MDPTLIVKTAALGDVLRTTSILSGLKARDPDVPIMWLTAPGAVDLVLHPKVERVLVVDPADAASIETVRAELSGERFGRVLSFDDERPLCELVTSLDRASLTGAYVDEEGRSTYTQDAAPWFDMGLLSVHGKQEADRLKVENRRTHPELFAEICGVEPGEPELMLPEDAQWDATEFAKARDLYGHGPVIGLNTGAGGRWVSKQLPVGRTLELAEGLASDLGGNVTFLVLGGPTEHERNVAILAGMEARGLRAIDAGSDNTLLGFAARVDRCDVVVSSDSLAMHIAIARRRPVVAFFAPTSAAEIELYGRGEKVASTAPDACSYRPDADNSTITADRLRGAVMRQLSAREA